MISFLFTCVMPHSLTVLLFVTRKINKLRNYSFFLVFILFMAPAYGVETDADQSESHGANGKTVFEDPDKNKPVPKSDRKKDKSKSTNAIESITLPASGGMDQGPDEVGKVTTDEAGEVYIMGDFEVSAEQDQGYHSAHTLSGSRTNALVKDTPISITVVNEELISDLNLDSIADITSVSASVTDSGGYAFGSRLAEQQITLRGLAATSQLYDFFTRRAPQDAYNRDRVEIARGTNTMVFGQSEPGGKANIFPKKAMFANDKRITEVKAGNREFTGRMDYNKEINDKLAVRVMASHSIREADEAHAEKKFDGVTTAITYRPTRNTSIQMHLEGVRRDNNNPQNRFRNDTGSFGHSGVPNDIWFNKDAVQFMPETMLEDIFTYGEGQVTVDGNARDKRIIRSKNAKEIPANRIIHSLYGTIKSREDLEQLMDVSNPRNAGRFWGPDPYLKSDAYLGIFSMQHMFSDTVSGKLAFMHENVEEDVLHRGGTMDVRYNKGTNPAEDPTKDINQLHFAATWDDINFFDKTSALRATLSWDLEFSKMRHQILLGADADYHERSETRLRQTYANGELDRNGRPVYYRYGDYGFQGARDFLQIVDNVSGYTGIRYNNRVDIDLPGSAISDGTLEAGLNSDSFLTLIKNINEDNEFGPAGEYQMKYMNGNRMYDEVGLALSLRLNSEGIPELQNEAGEPILGKDGKPITYQYDGVLNTQWALNNTEVGKQRKVAVWSAVQSKFFNGRLSTLLGMRLDYTDADSVTKRYSNSDDSPETATWTQKPVYRSASPSLGAVFWVTDNFGIYGSWSKSIFAPSGALQDPVGNVLPPEIGEGLEGGCRFEFLEGKVNGEVVVYHITKENERLPSSVLNQSTKEELYPRSQYPNFWELVDQEWVFNGLPNSIVPGATLRSQGAEMRLNYNPTSALTLNFNYSNNVVKNKKMPLGITEGDLRAGTSRHKATLTARYQFTKGPLRGGFIGANQIYRSSPLLGTAYMDIGDSVRDKLGDLDGIPDYVPIEGAQPVKYQIWLDEQWETNLFLGWSGQFKKGRGNPKFRCQFNVRNLFDNQQLTRNGRYLEGRLYIVSARMDF